MLAHLKSRLLILGRASWVRVSHQERNSVCAGQVAALPDLFSWLACCLHLPRVRAHNLSLFSLCFVFFVCFVWPNRFFVCFVWLVRFLSVLFDLSVFLSVLFNLSVLQVSWASNCNDFAKGQFVRKKLFLWVCFVCFVLFACYVWFCLLCVFVSSFLQPGLLITLPRAVCALGALFVWFFVPETSGKTLSQLASIYKKDPHQEKDVNHF